jgi:hypothetical protein
MTAYLMLSCVEDMKSGLGMTYLSGQLSHTQLLGPCDDASGWSSGQNVGQMEVDPSVNVAERYPFNPANRQPILKLGVVRY